jgi:DNA polymerase III alpha subunit
LDVDFDTKMNFKPLDIFPEWIRASMVKEGVLRPHPCGVHPANVPTDPLTNLSAVPYQEAENLGIFKLDFLHLSVYDHFQSRREIEALLEIDPPWELLKSPSVCKNLFQNLGKHFELVNQVSPRSIQELADALALIRPAKRYLLKNYLDPAKRADTRKRLYEKAEHEEGYHYKKSHAIAYAMVIVLQLHLVSAGVDLSVQPSNQNSNPERL